MASQEDVWELIVKTIGADKVKEMTTLLEGLNEEADKIEEVEPKAEKAAKGMSALQQRFTAAGYAMQDFTATSGDFGAKLNSITNNIPNLLAGLGGLGTALSMAATVGVAVYRNWDQIAKLWETRNPFPKASNDINTLKRELEQAKDEMEKFEKAGTGTAASIAKYNDLRVRTAEIEKTITAEQERQAELKREEAERQKYLEAPTEETEGRAKGFVEATKGEGEKTLEKITFALQKSLEDELAEEWKQRTARVEAIKAKELGADEELAQINAVNKFYQEQKTAIEKEMGKIDANAQDMLDALRKGDKLAFEHLGRLIDSTGNLFGDLKTRMDEANPAIKKKADDASKAFDEEMKILTDAAKRQTDKIKAAGDELDAYAKEQKHASDAQEAAEEELAAFVEHATADRRKAAAHAFDLEMKALLADTAEAEKRTEAEAKRIHMAAGEAAGKQFGATVGAQAMTGGDPEKVAQVLARQLAAQFHRMGATPAGAGLAAQQIAAQAGFRVQRPQLAQPAMRAAPPKGGEEAQAIGQVQWAVGTTQQAVAQNINAIRQVNARTKALLATAKELNRRAREESTTAQNVGH